MKAMQVMSALSQATRYAVFELLVQALPEGVTSGDLAVATHTAPSAMSAHLAILARAGLVMSDRVGKTIVYRADTTPIEELSDLLLIKFIRLGKRLRGKTSKG